MSHEDSAQIVQKQWQWVFFFEQWDTQKHWKVLDTANGPMKVQRLVIDFLKHKKTLVWLQYLIHHEATVHAQATQIYFGVLPPYPFLTHSLYIQYFICQFKTLLRMLFQ